MQRETFHLSEKVTPLTFGSIISLSSIDSSDSFIHVDGFIKDKVLVKRFDTTDSKLMYSKCLFQIYPTFINTYKKEALALQEAVDVSRKPKAIKRVEIINSLQEKIATEFSFNLETFKKVTGQPILFGQPVQLLHVTSNKFLACRNTEADIEKENYKISLNEFSSDATVFKFFPCYKHQKESEGIIYIDDHIFITTTNVVLNKVSYIHLSKPTNVKIKKAELKEENQVLGLQANEVTKSRPKIEVNSSLESQTKLKMNFYSIYQPETISFLECGDIVWLNHSELDATLVCTTQFKDNFFKHKIEFDVSQTTDNFKQFLGNTNGMWIIEDSVYHKGGLVRWDHSYRFKHLSSGLYLGVSSVKKKGDRHSSSKITLENEANEENLFVLLPVSTGSASKNASNNNKHFVTKGTFVLIMHKKTGLVIQGAFNRSEVKRKSGADNMEDNMFMSDTKPCLIKHGAGSEEAALKIIKANYNEVWETYFLISCFPLLRSFLETITSLNNVSLLINFGKLIN